MERSYLLKWAILFIALVCHATETASVDVWTRCIEGCIKSRGYQVPCTSNPSRKIGACYKLWYGSCKSTCAHLKAQGAEERARERKEELLRREKKAAIARQRVAAKTAAAKFVKVSDGVMISPGERGNLGHSKRCNVASDSKVLELVKDQSDALWAKAKPLLQAAVRKLINPSDFEGIKIINKVEAQCRAIGNEIARVDWINNVGGGKIQDVFKKNCELGGHLEGVAEDGLVDAGKLVFDSPAGEYLSLLFNKVFRGKWPNSIQYCSLVCRKNKSGIDLKRCVYGCAETLQPNCWSQCDVYTCRRGCKNAFWHRRRKRNRCYDRCESKCTLK